MRYRRGLIRNCELETNAVIRNQERNETKPAAVDVLCNERADIEGSSTGSGTHKSVTIG